MKESCKLSRLDGKFRIFATAASLFCLACSSAGKPEPRALPSKPPAPQVDTLQEPALTADEELVEVGLKRHVEMLSGKIGERNPQKLWELAEAADYLANELEKLGFPVDRQGYETAGIAAQNLVITVHGGAKGDETLVLGAHYDSPPGNAGSNAGASGAAALLELARLMRDARLNRSLRIVFFALGESPHGDGEARGARQFSRKLATEASQLPKPGLPEAVANVSRVQPIGLIHLDRVGVFRDLNSRVPKAHLHWSGSSGGERLFFALRESLEGDPFRLSADSGTIELESDMVAFSEMKLPVLSLSGEASSPEQPLQYAEMAQFVMRLRFGIGELLGESPTNDGMVTPLGSRLR